MLAVLMKNEQVVQKINQIVWEKKNETNVNEEKCHRKA